MSYPISENKVSKWTAEFRKEYNKKYRQQVKNGERTPNKYVENSKWNDRDFRKTYETSRRHKIAEEVFEKKVSLEPELITSRHTGRRPNYSQLEKDELLKKMIEMLKQGQDVDHPYLMLTLDYKPEQKRDYNFKK